MSVKIIDKTLLQEFREKRRCEFCGNPAKPLQPHHLFGKGAGGWRRFDISINLIALCVFCHADFHAGLIMRCDLLAVVAAREKTTQDAIVQTIYNLRRGIQLWPSPK